MDEKTLAEKCFEYRVANDLNQTEMAALCKLHQQTIHNCESGKRIGRMSAAKICAVIGDEIKEE